MYHTFLFLFLLNKLGLTLVFITRTSVLFYCKCMSYFYTTQEGVTLFQALQKDIEGFSPIFLYISPIL